MNCKKECMEQNKDGTIKDCPIIKENEKLKAEIANYEETVDRLYEDQKDLAGELELWQRENAELKKQIDQLSNDNHVLKTSFITQQEQIEKMKNVGNCKHSMKCAEWNEKQSYLGLMKFCLNCKNWELAE